MVLFIDIIRKFSFRSFTQYVNQVAKAVIDEFVKGLPEAVDDDLRGLGALSLERHGASDNLTMGTLITKGQAWKSIYEGDQNELVVWLYGDEVNSDVWQNRSGWEGQIDRSIIFDGNNDYIDLTNDATLWSQSLTKFSFTIWIYPTINDLGSRRVVHHGAGTAQGFNLYMANPSDLAFEIRNAANGVIDTRLTSLTLYQWHFIACVYDNSLGSANLKLYVDGVLVGTPGNLTEAINKSATLRISDDTSDLRGNAKDFRWWTTKALSAAEVAALFKLSPIPTPDYWLKMTDSGTGNPTDAISGTKVGTLSNGAAWDNFDRSKVISRVGNPCVVKTSQNFIGRQEVGYFNDDGGDGGVIADHRDIQMAQNGAGITISYWLYVVQNQDNLIPVFPATWSILADGVNDSIDCTNDATLWSQSLTKFSFSFWIYPTVAWDGVVRTILAHGQGSAQTFSVYFSSVTQGRINFQIRNAAGTAIIATNDTVALNEWNFITCVYDNSLGSNNIKIYVDNVVGTNATLTEAINTSNTLLLEGYSPAGTWFAGYMKDFRWWTTLPLSVAQVDALYRGLFQNDALVPNYWLPMDEGTGSTTIDIISNTKVATLSGAVWSSLVTPPMVESFPRTIYRKTDDSTHDLSLFLDPVNKRLCAQIRSGSFTVKGYDNAYAYNTWTYHVFTYNNSTGAVQFYKDGVLQTAVNPNPSIGMNYDPAEVDAAIAWTGRIFGEFVSAHIALYNFKIWKNKILTAGEITNENTNKFSISNITAAQRPIAGFMATAVTDSYTKISYTSISYTTSY